MSASVEAWSGFFAVTLTVVIVFTAAALADWWGGPRR